jgi:hypothetical protein
MRNRILKVLIGLLFLSVFFIWCLDNVVFGAPIITVVNNTQEALNEIIIKGNGFQVKIGSIDSKEKRSIVVHPIGESSLEIS